MAIRVDIPLESFNILDGFLSQIREEVRECTEDAARKVAGHIFDVIHRNISIDSHTLQDLRELGHPYSRKNQTSGNILGLKPYQVHTQRGVIRGTRSGPLHLVDALGIDTDIGTHVMEFIVGIDESDARHVRYVVLGTVYMVARDFFVGSLLEAVEQMFKIFESETGFTKVVVDFSV